MILDGWGAIGVSEMRNGSIPLSLLRLGCYHYRTQAETHLEQERGEGTIWD